MKTQRTKKQQAFLVIATLADIGSIIMALFYIAYSGLMMLVFGMSVLKWIMVGLTVLYIWFVIFKIAYLNRVMQRAGRMKKIVKLSSKYMKFVMRIINAVFVVLSIIGAPDTLGWGGVVAIIGIVFMCISLFISIIWDIWSFMLMFGVKQVIVATKAARAGNSPQIDTGASDVVEAYGEEVK